MSLMAFSSLIVDRRNLSSSSSDPDMILSPITYGKRRELKTLLYILSVPFATSVAWNIISF
jgi:hypothetical protein